MRNFEEKCTGTVPFCGQSENKEYHYEGKSHPMGQHGFAETWICRGCTDRDGSMVFLRSNEETKAKYPVRVHFKSRL